MVNIIVTILAAVAGCLMCFEGYKLFRLSLGIAGGVAGFILAKVLIELTANTIAWSSLAKTIVLAVFTVGLAILAFTLYMKALIAITMIVCAFWFFDDFSFLFSKIENSALRILFTYLAGLLAGALVGVIVYYAQKWTISLFTAYVGARIISGVLSPIIWSGVSSAEYVGVIEQKILGADIGINYTLVRVLLLVAFCAAGFVIQLKTSKKIV
ncbi:MAG: hypothetical protein K5875_05905 [Saccharofermentans sp.]|nr:hypothetical protein [Clostridiales bacterium]MCR4767476.1 hypothetical protein [Saccharofermentans sp.]